MAADHFCLKWNNFHNSIVTVFESLQSSEELVDVTLMCEGQNVKAHKVILSACSPYFRNLFKEIPCQHPVIILKDVLHCDLVAILQFMYQGEVLITQDGLASFLKTAELLQVSGLAGNPATTRTATADIESILPTQVIVPVRVPSPIVPPSPTSPAKLTIPTKNHATPATESASKEKENIDTEQPTLSQFETAIEPIQSCSYEPHEELVIKTEADEVEFPEMDYTSMSHDHTNDSGPPTEEQSILERSLKAHGTQNLFILNEPNTRQIVEKEKLDRYMPSKSKLFIKCPYCCKSMLRRSFKKHLKFCTFLKSNKPLRPEIEHDHDDESLKNDMSKIDSTVNKIVKETPSVPCPHCDKLIKWKHNLNKHIKVCKYKPSVVEHIENLDEVIIKRVTRKKARKSLDCRPFLPVIDQTNLRRSTRKSLDCRSFANFSKLEPEHIPDTPIPIDIQSICSTDSDITVGRKRRSSTRKSIDCRNCAGCS